MDIRNFFGVKQVTKKSSQSSEKESKPDKHENKNKRSRRDSKEHAVTKKSPKSTKKDTKKTKGSKKDVESDEQDIINIDSDVDMDDDFQADENGNNSKKVKTKDPKSTSNECSIKHKAEKTSEKPKKKTSLDDSMEEDIIKTTKGNKTKRSHRIIDSDSEEDPTPKKKNKKSKSRNGDITVIDDSDEESKPRKTTLDTFLKSPGPNTSKTPSSVKKSNSTEKSTPVNINDFFGGGSVKRSDRKTVASKRKLDEDSEMHDDDDFEKTLQQLDQPHRPKKPKVDVEEKHSKKSSSSSPTKEKSSLSSKLSKLAKSSVNDATDRGHKVKPEILVPDTPVSKKSPKKASPKKAESPKKVSPVKMEFTPKRTSPGAHKAADTPKTSPGHTKGKKTSPDQVTGAKTSSKKSPQKSGHDETKKSPEVPPSVEKKASYRSYLTREGPRSLGSKEIPEGADNCLEGLTFVITGVLESFERDEAKHMVEKYGGKVTGSISKKTNYLIAGRDSGESKLSKAQGFGTKIIDEDGLLELIRTKPGKKSKYVIQAEESIKKENSFNKIKSETSKKSEKVEKLQEFERKPSQGSSSSPRKTGQSEEISLMWVDKYKPTALKQVIGQQGEKSNAKKLLNWLSNWHKNRAANVKPQGKFFGKDETGAGFRAALLSGPPGIGKTTTATLVCKEAGFTFVELNASDTRSKKSLQTEVSEALSNETITDFFGANKSVTHGLKHCLVMDEVDGMAGNEDRGGMQELVQLVKTTKIPIICMCNDRNSQKMRTLSNYCFDLRFQRPRLEQIKAAMMSIAFKEGLKVAPPALNEMIQAANQDIRQVIHNLSMWTASEKTMSYEQTKKDADRAKKDMKLGPFDVCRKVFVGGEETAGMTLIDKSDLFFHDYSFGPLFVQENYIHVRPFNARGSATRHLSLLARAADSIGEGDLVDRKIRSNQAWSLLPTQAIFSSVLPGEYMRGSFPQMVAFPSWLGKNSSTNKTERIIQELRTHMRLKISGDKKSLNMDYLPFMRHSLTEPMVKHESEGVQDVIQLMDDYDIIKEDYDNILEISKWPNSRDPLKDINPKTKAAFTRTYNKEVHMTPYSTGAVAKKRRSKAAADNEDMEEFGEEGEQPPVEDSEEEDDLELDTMIKAKKKSATKGKEAVATSSKGKGPAKGKGQAAKGKGRGKGKS